MYLILEKCRLYCFDKWGECCKKSSSRSQFWVKMHGFFWSILHRRLTYEKWIEVYQKADVKKDVKK